MFVWAREANNVEAPYRSSEAALLEMWHLLHGDLARRGGAAEQAGLTFNELVELHFAVWDDLFEHKILPFADARHALSTAVASHASIDVNLKLFELIGRLALRGLWLAWQLGAATDPIVLTNERIANLPAGLSDANGAIVARIDRLCEQLMQIIGSNRALLSPIGDWQAIDIGLALTLLATRPRFHGAIDQWVEELTNRAIFAYKVHGRYPTTSHSYWDLVEHPERTEAYRKQATEGSILYPMLALWAAARGDQDVVDTIATFATEDLEHCTFQTWFPDADSEANLYLGHDNHGAALTGIPVNAGTGDTLDFVLNEIVANPHYDELSVIRLGHWPLLLTACRHYRLPVPPTAWRALLPAIGRPSITAPTPLVVPHASRTAEDISRQEQPSVDPSQDENRQSQSSSN